MTQYFPCRATSLYSFSLLTSNDDFYIVTAALLLHLDLHPIKTGTEKKIAFFRWKISKRKHISIDLLDRKKGMWKTLIHFAAFVHEMIIDIFYSLCLFVFPAPVIAFFVSKVKVRPNE